MDNAAMLGLAVLGRRRVRGRVAVRAVSTARFLAGVYLLLVGVLLTSALLPLLVGWRPYLLTSGAASPSLPRGAVVLADQGGAAEVRAGQLALVHDPTDGRRLAVRRVVATGFEGTLGVEEAGHSAPARVPAMDVVGRVRAVVPFVGLLPVRGVLGWLGTVVAAGFFALTPTRRRAA